MGFAISVGLILKVLSDLLLWRPFGGFLAVIASAVVVLALSWVVFMWPITRFRWTRLLPGHPAVLLVPATVAVWAGFCSLRWYGPHHWDEWKWNGWGVPLPFYGFWWSPDHYDGFRLAPFLFDLVLALAVAWLFALAVDWLVLRRVRARRGGIRSPEEPDLPNTP